MNRLILSAIFLQLSTLTNFSYSASGRPVSLSRLTVVPVPASGLDKDAYDASKKLSAEGLPITYTSLRRVDPAQILPEGLTRLVWSQFTPEQQAALRVVGKPGNCISIRFVCPSEDNDAAIPTAPQSPRKRIKVSAEGTDAGDSAPAGAGHAATEPVKKD